ncbi:hypothetical protein K438DRAFT_2014304 [Mycena galopus ATCC 62051]|nr:hypothetical protein K438DRAFT_2014304 [Mycena galopus ATCC 62051]
MEGKRKADDAQDSAGHKRTKSNANTNGFPGRKPRRSRAKPAAHKFDSDNEEEPVSSTSSTPALDPGAPPKTRFTPLVPSHFRFSWDAASTDTPTTIASAANCLGEPSLEQVPGLEPIPEPEAVLESPKQPTEKFGPWQSKVKRPQGSSVALGEVISILPDIQERILATFTHAHLDLPCECGEIDAIFRCVECFNAPLWCRSCIVKVHRYSPFHHIEKWDRDGKLFVRHSLDRPKSQKGANRQPTAPATSASEIPKHERGLLLQTHLASDGQPCPNAHPQKPKTREFTIADHNGFHTRQIQFCECIREDFRDYQQLLAVRLFPASWKHPQTAFTFGVMKQFHIHTLASQKSAYNFVKALCMLTDNSSHHDVTDRYREFLFACRLWRYLALQRRSGQAHNIDFWVGHRRAHSLTVRCPACPEVGFNMSAEEMQAALARDRHKFTLFLSVDGNFKLQRKYKRDDPNDFALNDGNGYFVETEDYKQYLKIAKPPLEEDLGTCTHLRAARMQNMAKFKNAVVTGVVAVQCARHGFYMPQGMVDLSKGEAFANTDYAVCFSLAEAEQQRWILFTYDIWCRYGIKLPNRIEEMFSSMSSIMEKIDGAIPKMHILNHLIKCQDQWNLNWLRHSGFTVGEMIESGWAVHNLTAGSTKEMNAGHRHDVIDNTSNHWNFEKMITLAATLLRLYRLAASERRSRSLNFENVDEQQRNQHPEAVAKWETMSVEPEIKGGKFFSVFQSEFKKGPPTHSAAYAKLHQAEVDAEKKSKATQEAADRAEAKTAGMAAAMAAMAKKGEAVETQDEAASRLDGQAVEGVRKGDLAIIGDGLNLERDREQIKWLVHTSAADDIVGAARIRFIKDTEALRTRQIQRVPDLSERMSEIDPEKPEKTKLLFPSQFNAAQRTAMGLAALAQVEYVLREGQAFDALRNLRTAIKTLNYNKQIRKTEIHGQGATTRAQGYLKTLYNDVHLAADTYRRMRAALVALGLPNDDKILKPLETRKKQLDGKAGKAPALGDARKAEAWFWSVIQPPGMSQEEEAEWELEMDRVKWFRDRALRDRAIEEGEILEAEFLRAIEWFRRNSEIWEEIANEKDKKSRSNGSQAYARKQSALYRKLWEGCKVEWARAPALLIADELADQKKAKAEAERTQAEAGEVNSLQTFRHHHQDIDAPYLLFGFRKPTLQALSDRILDPEPILHSEVKCHSASMPLREASRFRYSRRWIRDTREPRRTQSPCQGLLYIFGRLFRREISLALTSFRIPDTLDIQHHQAHTAIKSFTCSSAHTTLIPGGDDCFDTPNFNPRVGSDDCFGTPNFNPR